MIIFQDDYFTVPKEFDEYFSNMLDLLEYSGNLKNTLLVILSGKSIKDSNVLRTFVLSQFNSFKRSRKPFD